MDEFIDIFLKIFLGVIMGILIGFLIGGMEVKKYRAEAIGRGYAIYCPNNGQWAWIGECE